MFENRDFFVELGGKKSRVWRLKNSLPQGSLLTPLLFNIYTNDQPKSAETHSFIYADNLGIGAQDTNIKVVEERPSNVFEVNTFSWREPPTIHPRHSCGLPPAKSWSQASAEGQLVRNPPWTLWAPSLLRGNPEQMPLLRPTLRRPRVRLKSLKLQPCFLHLHPFLAS